MVDAPQPATNEGYRPSHSNSCDKSKTPSHWQDEITHTQSLAQPGSRLRKQVCAYPAISLPFSRAREALPRRLMNGRGIGGSGEEHYEYPLFLAPRSPLRCEQPSSCWCSALGCSSRIFSLRKFSLENAPRQRCFCGGPKFMKILCA